MRRISSSAKMNTSGNVTSTGHRLSGSVELQHNSQSASFDPSLYMVLIPSVTSAEMITLFKCRWTNSLSFRKLNVTSNMMQVMTSPVMKSQLGMANHS